MNFFAFPWQKKSSSHTETLTRGIELGFRQAREYPELTWEEFKHDIDHLIAQLKNKSNKELKHIIKQCDET